MNDTQSPPPDSDLVTVVGEVAEITDLVPVDGGAAIRIVDEPGGSTMSYIESFFGAPNEEAEVVYETLRDLEVGDRVEVGGVETEQGLLLEKLTKLDG